MAILVDDARWPWRGTYWCHLVSDADLGELHEFARRLGCRRVGFQGDHYDIDVVTRDRAIELGAEPCDSRQLVRRLKSADLRLRPCQFTKWSLVSRGDAADIPREFVDDALRPFASQASGYFVLTRPREDGTTSMATIVHGQQLPDLPSEDPVLGRYVRVERDGTWSIELISPPPTDRE